ncbi:MAG: hypothetical protein KGZ79_08475 [Dethiobacter sp.]|jgi:predicted nuclease with TOPRIM domain|nr:hypothetical protein [Dethiobacter sp.]
MEERMFQELMGRFEQIQDSLRQIQEDMLEVRVDVSELKTDVSGLNGKVSRIEEKQDMIFAETAGLLEFRTETLLQLQDLQINHKSISALLGEHDIQIRSLQRRV